MPPFSGSGVTVAVLDTGIDSGHPAFAGVDLVLNNFTRDSSVDTDGHGTHCAGTIFGRDVNGTRIGMCRGVKRALIAKVLGPEGGDSVTILWAVSEGAQVISMAWEWISRLSDATCERWLPRGLGHIPGVGGLPAQREPFQNLSNLVRLWASFGPGYDPDRCGWE
jgi:subtilisin family serine protease